MSDPRRITKQELASLLSHVHVLKDSDARALNRATIEVEKARRWMKKDPSNPERRITLEVMLRIEARLRQRLFLPAAENPQTK